MLRAMNVRHLVLRISSTEITITLSNEGDEAFKPELYGKEIQIVRKIGMKKSDYKILSDRRKVVSTRKETIAEMIQALSISPENPLCILHQEVAKTFLLNSDARKKYQVSENERLEALSPVFLLLVLYESLSNRPDETSVRRRSLHGTSDWSTHPSDERCACSRSEREFVRIAVFQRHRDLVRAMEPLQQEVKKIEIRRDREKKKVDLEAELILARTAEAQRVSHSGNARSFDSFFVPLGTGEHPARARSNSAKPRCRRNANA